MEQMSKKIGDVINEHKSNSAKGLGYQLSVYKTFHQIGG